MPLASQVVDVKFTQGLDTKTQSKLVLPGKWETLINLSLAEDGSLRRRNGFEVVLNGQAGNGLATHGNQLLVVDGPGLRTVVAGVAATSAAVTGKIGNVGIRKTEVRRTTGMQDTPDCDTGTPSGAVGAFTAYAWREKSATNTATGINCTVVDETTGARIFDNFPLRTSATAFGVRVVFADSRFFFFFIDGTSLRCRVLDPTTATAGADTALITSASLAGISFDACQFPSDGEATVLYGWAAGGISARAITVSQAANVPAIAAGPTDVFAQATSPIASMNALCIAMFSGGTLAGCFAASFTSGIVGATLDVTTAVVTAETVINPTVSATNANRHLTAVIDSTRMRLFYDYVSEWNTNAVNPITAQVVSTTLATFTGPTNIINANTYGAGTTARGPQGPFIHGKAFSEGGRIFVPVYVASVYASLAGVTANPRSLNSQNTLFILDTGATATTIATGVVVAKALYGVYGVASINANPPTIGTPCSSPEVTSGDFITVSGELTRLVITDVGNVSPTGIVRIDMLPQFVAPPERLQIGENTIFAGGSVAQFDGSTATEVGFPLFPEGVAITVLGAGGAMTAGRHVVCVVYEWVDGAGNRVQSAACPPISVTTVANDSLSVFVPTLQLSQKTNVQVVAYMTQAEGLTLNRVLLDNGLYAPVFNSTAANTVTLTIDDADATIAGNELLYTQPLQGGATLANVAPNPMHGIGVSQNRLWGFLSDEPNEYAPSQELLPNTALQFNNDALGGRVPSDAGEGVKIAELDEKTVLLCERKLYVVYGSGPDPSGASNNFSEPQPIPSDVGCSEERSVLLTPAGLMFKSPKGWYLLGRDLSVRYIGEGVARYDANTVSSAVLLEDQQEARFTSVDADGPTLVYDYTSGQWSTYFMGNALHPGSLADAIWWPATSRYVHLQTAAGEFPGVMQETPGVYVDGAGAATPLQALIYARTAFLHAAALEHFQRVRWMYLTATADTSPTTSLIVAVDFDDVYNAGAPGAYTFTALLSSLGTPAPSTEAIDIRHHMRFQKCKSVAFSFLEGGGTTSTAAPLTGLQAMALELGLKKGVKRLRAAQSF